MKDLKIGQKRTFDFARGKQKIIEILDGSGLTMQWNWRETKCTECKQVIEICPHCQKKLGGLKEHEFDRIELLIPENLELKGHEDKLIILGFTKDDKIMRVPAEQTYRILAKSKAFKERGDKHGN